MANQKPIDVEDILNKAATSRAILGHTYRDVISGLTGIAISRTTFLYSCVRVALQPPGLKDGMPYDGFYVDEKLLEEVPDTKVIPYTEEPDLVVLGNTYRDSITDFEGVATTLTKFLAASQRVGLQPSKLHEGATIKEHYFDAHQIAEVEPVKIPKTQTAGTPPGGPGNCAPPHKSPSRF